MGPVSHSNGLAIRKQLQMDLSRKVFGEVDKNNDGKLSPEEFNGWAKKNRASSSRNGVFSEEEFVSTTASIAAQNGVEADISEHAKEVFASLDADQNKELRRGEWASGVPLFF